MVKYDITVRSLLKNDSKPDELVVRRYIMDANEVSQWISQTMAECKAVLCFREYPREYPSQEVTEDEITAQFNEIVEAINALEQAHETKSLTFKVLKSYVTVQVIFPDEESI